jgi:hypothetical protein
VAPSVTATFWFIGLSSASRMLRDDEAACFPEQRLACLQHMLREAAVRHARLRVQPLAPLDEVREVEDPCRLVDRGDGGNLSVEDLLDPVADRVVDRLLVELTCDRFLHVVDQGQLRVPLPRLVHQLRVLQRHAQAAGERLQELLIRLAESVPAVHVLQRDEAGYRAADEERHEQSRLRLLVRHHRKAQPLPRSRDVLLDQQRLAGLDHETHETEAVQWVRLPGLALAALDRVWECTTSAARSYVQMSTICASKTSWSLAPTAS